MFKVEKVIRDPILSSHAPPPSYDQIEDAVMTVPSTDAHQGANSWETKASKTLRDGANRSRRMHSSLERDEKKSDLKFEQRNSSRSSEPH